MFTHIGSDPAHAGWWLASTQAIAPLPALALPRWLRGLLYEISTLEKEKSFALGQGRE